MPNQTFWSSTSKRSRGRPKDAWRRTVKGAETQKIGFANWNEAVAAARDRAERRGKGAMMALFSMKTL